MFLPDLFRVVQIRAERYTACMNQIAETTTETENTVESFDELDLSPVMRQAVKKAGFSTPSPIQAQLIPLAMEGEDVIGQARTGTGENSCFRYPDP